MDVEKDSKKGSTKEQYINTIKTYIVPTIALLFIGLVKLQSVGVLREVYLWLTGQPLYVENDTLGLFGVFTLVILDMLVGVIYVWVRNIGKVEEDEAYLEVEGSTAKDTTSKQRTLKVKESLQKAIDGDGVKRGFNYLWMSSMSSVMVAVLWSLVAFISLNLFEDMIIQNPTMYLALFMVMTVFRTLINAVIKTGVLAYTVNATVKESNILRALWFTTVNLLKIIWIEIRYIAFTALGLVFLLVGALGTHAIALEKRVERWETLVRNYERDRLYGTFR